MKKVLFAVLVMITGVAFADQATTDVSTNSASVSNATTGTQEVSGNSMGNLYYAPVSETKIPRGAVNTAVGSQTITSNDTCMGSSSGGITTYGISISAGTTWTDNNCIMLKNARELWNMGLRDAAVARMCMDDNNRDALEVTGIKCPDFDEIRKNRKHK